MNINESANKEREEYGKRAEYNREHLPSKELPPLSPDWVVLSEFILNCSGGLLMRATDTVISQNLRAREFMFRNPNWEMIA